MLFCIYKYTPYLFVGNGICFVSFVADFVVYQCQDIRIILVNAFICFYEDLDLIIVTVLYCTAVQPQGTTVKVASGFLLFMYDITGWRIKNVANFA